MELADPHRLTWPRRVARLWPLGPIFGKELRQMARRKRSYFLRFAYLGLLLSILGSTWLLTTDSYRYSRTSIVEQAAQQAKMGAIFFGVFAFFSIVAMHLIGPILTSTAIGSERLHRTLDVLLMTPITAWQIVAGKLFSRLLSALTLLGLSLPVLAIVRLLGGVELDDMFGVLGLAAATAISSAAIGLFLSCFLKRAWAVILLAFLIEVAIYFILPLLMLGLLASLSGRMTPARMTAMQWIATTNPLITTGSQVSPGSGPRVTWESAIAAQLILAAGLTLLSAAVVRRTQRRIKNEAGIAPAAPLPPPDFQPMPATLANDSLDTVLDDPANVDIIANLAHATSDETALPPTLPSQIAATRRNRRRPVGENPVLWSELRRPLLPRLWQRVTLTSIVLGLLTLSYIVLAAAGNSFINPLAEHDVQLGYVFIMHTLLLLIAIVISSTSIATEKESDTWTLLIASPLSGTRVVWGKFAGVLRRMIFPYALMILHLGIFTIAGVLPVVCTLLVIWVSVTFNMVWIATGVYLSLKLKRVTSAVVANLLLPVAAYGLAPLALGALGAIIQRPTRADDWAEIVCAWLPYWYQGVTISRLYYYFDGSFDDRYAYIIRAPFFHHAIGFPGFIALTLAVGVAHLVVTAVILGWSSTRFDRIVGRAPTK
jgi:ABC-type transport system involved in multi-copper enzyme maturation permease subunit